ncbi:hypothetical protein [Nostoc sp.]|uniref:hypothetical protein n=1 Tax=Nostoc sp. TaxID=1180 RepID=UPI002FF4CF27
MQRSAVYDDLRQRTDLVEKAIAYITFIAKQRCLRQRTDLVERAIACIKFIAKRRYLRWATPTHQQKL